MARQQAFYRAQAAFEVRFRRASALAGLLVVVMFFANLAYLTSPRRRLAPRPARVARPVPRW
jgi:hypothetical protein